MKTRHPADLAYDSSDTLLFLLEALQRLLEITDFILQLSVLFGQKYSLVSQKPDILSTSTKLPKLAYYFYQLNQ